MIKNIVVVVAGFGGPRCLSEVEPFLRALLTDQEMVRTPLPGWLHRMLFSLIAKWRAPSLARKYALIGGHSPTVDETEKLCAAFDCPAIPFHRYLPSTHASFLERLKYFDEIVVLPLYPQYSCVTTGSLKVWMEQHVPRALLQKFRWIDSYADHPVFIEAWVGCIRSFLEEKGVKEKEVILLFSAHGLPQKIVDKGDPYEKECRASFQGVAQHFPSALCRLSYQSRVGWGKWLGPSTKSVCQEILSWNEGRKTVIFVPISFTTDHIETLHEIEYEYLPLIQAQGLNTYRCPVKISSKLSSLVSCF